MLALFRYGMSSGRRIHFPSVTKALFCWLSSHLLCFLIKVDVWICLSDCRLWMTDDVWTISCERTNERTNKRGSRIKKHRHWLALEIVREIEWENGCVCLRERERERERMCERKKRIKVKNIAYFYIDRYEYPTST